MLAATQLKWVGTVAGVARNQPEAACPTPVAGSDVTKGLVRAGNLFCAPGCPTLVDNMACMV